MRHNKVKDCTTSDCEGFKIYDFVDQFGVTDNRIMVIEDCQGIQKKMFKSTMSICMVGYRDCPIELRDMTAIQDKYISLIGRNAACFGDRQDINASITSTGEQSLMELYKLIKNTASGGGSGLENRVVLTGVTGTRLEVTGFTLPSDNSKVLFFKNGQLQVENEPNAYVINGNGFDLLAPAGSGDIYEIIVIS